MGSIGTLETGVDKLLNLVREKKKISMKEAASILNVPQGLLKQWVEILEEEGVISLDYLFTMPFIVERKKTKEDEKEYTLKKISKQKDLFINQAESIKKALEKESLTINNLKKEFETVKNELGPDMKFFTTDLKNYDNLNKIKDTTITELRNEHESYIKKIIEIIVDLKMENEKFRSIKNEIDDSNEKLINGIINLSKIKYDPKNEKNIKQIENEIFKIREDVFSIKKEIRKSQNKNKILKPKIKEISKRIGLRNRKITNLIKKAKNGDSKLKQKEKIIKQKFIKLKKNIQMDIKANRDITDKLIDFFEKKQKIKLLIQLLAVEKEKLEKNLDELINEAKKDKTKNHIEHAKYLNQKMHQIEEKRRWFRAKLNKLVESLK